MYFHWFTDWLMFCAILFTERGNLLVQLQSLGLNGSTFSACRLPCCYRREVG